MDYFLPEVLVFCFKKNGGKVEQLGGKKAFCEISVSTFLKEVKFSLKWVEQSEQILFEK
jgi:hypothetical protein